MFNILNLLVTHFMAFKAGTLVNDEVRHNINTTGVTPKELNQGEHVSGNIFNSFVVNNRGR